MVTIYSPEVVQKVEKNIKDNESLVVGVELNNSVRSINDYLTAGCLSPDNWDSMVQKHLKKR